MFIPSIAFLFLLNLDLFVGGSADVLFLIRRKSVYRIPRYTISLVRDGSVRASERVVRDSAVARDVLLPLFTGLDREQFVVMALDTKHKVIGLNVVSIGSLSMSIVHPREVFKPVILLNASAFILAHNHPSDDLTPSPEDYALTRRLKEAGECLGIPVLDHLIVSDNGAFLSFADRGMLQDKG